jgi:cytochrome c553
VVRDGGDASAALGEAVTRRLQKVKRVLVEEAGGCCAVCDYDRCLINLHFHHVNPATKSFAISVASGKSIAAYREEVKKCVLVCANCHGEIETGMIESPPPSGFVRTNQAPLADSAPATISVS